MTNIKIKNQEKQDNSWKFLVAIQNGKGEMEYSVEMDEQYYQKLCGGKIEPGELVKKSFEFLLARESKESILKKFNLRVIQQYFPEYEEKISL